MNYQFTCAVCGTGFDDSWHKRRRVTCSPQCRVRLQEGRKRHPLSDNQKVRMSEAQKVLAVARDARHKVRRRQSPTADQRERLIREWILDMRASEKVNQ